MLIASVVLVAGCGRVGFEPSGGTSGDGGTIDAPPVPTQPTRRNDILILGSSLNLELNDFPLFVRLAMPDFDRAAMQADGDDLRFFTESGEPIPYEVNVAGPTVDCWVLVPFIAAGTADTFIYVTYGDPNATAAANPTAVWPTANHVGVWHFDVDGRESTVNQLDGTFVQGGTSSGVAGFARTVSGGGYVEVADAPALTQLGTDGTASWSIWANATTHPAAGLTTLIGRQRNNTPENDFRLGTTVGGGVNGELTLDPGDVQLNVPSGANITTGGWHHIAMTYDGSLARIYIDGVQRSSAMQTSTVNSSAVRVIFGADCNACQPGGPNEDFFDGSIDEARIYGPTMPGGWFDAETKNLNGTLVVVQPFEPL